MIRKSLFHGSYHIGRVTAEPHSSERAFVFSGQGSAYPGMFRSAFGGTPTIQKFFAGADKLCSYFDLLPASHYVYRPEEIPQEKIHIYRSCALFVVEVALAEYIEKQGLPAKLSAAHSFGECAALVHAGVIDFEAMMKVVIHRNLICPAPNSLGWMVAVNAESARIEELLKLPGTFLANTNSPRQSVISVSAAEKDRLIAELRQKRMPYILLEGLPQPYHSPMMEPYRILMREKIAKLNLIPTKPRLPFFSGVTLDWIDQENWGTLDYADLLSRQITEPVNFPAIVTQLQHRGAGSFYEIGPGKMLDTSLRGNLGNRPATVRNTEDLLRRLSPKKSVDYEKIGKLKGSRWFDRLKEVIQSVTGYSAGDIMIDQNFQDNLGIDSIKKAEILFKLISKKAATSHPGFSTMRFNHLYEAVEYLENYSESADPLRISYEAEISLLSLHWKKVPLQRAPFVEAQAGGFEVYEVSGDPNFPDALDGFLVDAEKKKKRAIVLVTPGTKSWSLEDLAVHHSAYLRWVRVEPRRDFHLVFADNSPDERLAPLVALWKSLRKELRSFHIGSIVCPKETPGKDIIIREVLDGLIRDAAYDGAIRSVREYEEIDLTLADTLPKLRILCIGGTRGILREILERLPHHAESELTIVGRRREQEVRAELDVLRSYWQRLAYVTADAEDSVALEGIISRYVSQHGEIDLLVNASGYQISRHFHDRVGSELILEHRGKVLPFRNLEALKEKYPIRRLLHFSSFVSQFGNRGQGMYSYNNRFLENHSGGVSHTISWGPWDSVGMTEDEGILQIIREHGISLIDRTQGSALAAKLFYADTLPPVVVAMDVKDIFLFATDQVPREDYAKVLGDIHDPFHAVFYRDVFLEKEPWVNDHVVYGKPVLPAAYFLSQLTLLSRFQFSELKTIRNFRIANLAILEDGHCHLKLQSLHRFPYEVHSYGLVPIAAAAFDLTSVLPKGKGPQLTATERVDAHTLYRDEVFRFGERFQLLKNSWLDRDKKFFTEIRISELPQMTGDVAFDFYLCLYEAAFQSVTIQTYFLHQAATLPQGIHKVLHREDVPITDIIRIYPQIKRVEESVEVCDVLICNSDNDVFCKILDFRVKLLRFDLAKSVTSSPIGASHES